MKYFIAFVLTFLSLVSVKAQTMGLVTGTVKDRNTQELLPGVTIALIGKDTVYTITEVNGAFRVETNVGRYNLEASYVGYENFVAYNINLTSGNAQVLQIELTESTKQLDEVVVRVGRTVRATDMVTPLATQRLSAEEIKVNPGGNFDVSKVIQVLPGVAGGTAPNRNDIIVRGGGPSENVYYLDGRSEE